MHLYVPKIWLLGSTSTWAHNLFVLWALGFLLWVVLCSVTQIYSLFLNSSHYLSKLSPFSLRVVARFFLMFSPISPTPIPHSLLIFIGQDEWRCYDYSPLLVWMGVQFHHHKVDAPSGKVGVAWELIPTSKKPLGSDVLKGTTGQSSTGQKWSGGVCLRCSS